MSIAIHREDFLITASLLDSHATMTAGARDFVAMVYGEKPP